MVIATTSFLSAVAEDIREAIEAGSNVITTAEEAAYPWANDADVADRLDARARERGVSILGAGLNPGFAFDALVLTACGVVPEVKSLLVERVVDLSGFGEAVLRRIGVAHLADSFTRGRRDGTVTGHIGFPQSMRVVAGALGVEIERIDSSVEPIFAKHLLAARFLTVHMGETAGFRQRYVAIKDGLPWFEALFTGHVSLPLLGEEPRDSITIRAQETLRFSVTPGINPQLGSASIVANSIRRVVAAPPGWVTVADLPPAFP
ncbi:MAG: NADP-binding protein [Actinobacteria bacterium]|nr:NADP-binding protein [Actinomycetota bacterium]